MADKKATKQEAVYTRAELMEGAARFGVKPEVIAGALKLAGKDSMTISEAEAAVKRFLAQTF
ncbi:oligoribonuclease [Paenibacillus alkalitolerans]|uniref:oligoribonuclease n=1 Tax=Paenibacillus alkalitolerans TaxID=2799335 RepID=UPI001F17B7BA|nr:oligoribonuclease [Paenibacillus alkalitolerans]